MHTNTQKRINRRLQLLIFIQWENRKATEYVSASYLRRKLQESIYTISTTAHGQGLLSELICWIGDGLFCRNENLIPIDRKRGMVQRTVQTETVERGRGIVKPSLASKKCHRHRICDVIELDCGVFKLTIISTRKRRIQNLIRFLKSATQNLWEIRAEFDFMQYLQT